MRDPTVSVIIPTYNRARSLARAIGSVLTQTHADLELLIVDDASTDHTPEFVQGLGDSRVRYLRQPRNGGPGAARNRGLGEARGTFIAFLDSDDEWVPQKLERQLGHFAVVPDRVGVVYTGGRNITADGPPQPFVPAFRGDLRRILLERNVLHGAVSSGLIRREVAERVGGFDVRLPAIEDYDYWVRVSAHCEFDFLEDLLITYHDEASDGRVSRARHENLRARAMFFEKHRADMERFGVAHLFLEESARRHLTRVHWDPAVGRRLTWQAILREPREPRFYALLAKSLIPTTLFHLLVRATTPPQSA